MKLRGALDMTLAQVCPFLHLLLLSIYPFSVPTTETPYQPTLMDFEWIELMIGCFESG